MPYNINRRAWLVKNKFYIYRKLFTSTFYLSAFTFGGGFVIIPLMKKKFVDDLKWIEEKEMLDLASIAQSSPGAIAVNASILLGYKMAGITGALITILGTALPPMIILSVISLFYKAFSENPAVNAVLHGMQSGVAAVIADVTLNLGQTVIHEDDKISFIVMITAFIAAFFLKVNVILIIATCAVIGVLKIVISEKHGKRD